MKLTVNDITELVRSITLLVLVVALVLVLASSGVIQEDLLIETYENLIPKTEALEDE